MSVRKIAGFFRPRNVSVLLLGVALVTVTYASTRTLSQRKYSEIVTPTIPYARSAISARSFNPTETPIHFSLETSTITLTIEPTDIHAIGTGNSETSLPELDNPSPTLSITPTAQATPTAQLTETPAETPSPTDDACTPVTFSLEEKDDIKTVIVHGASKMNVKATPEWSSEDFDLEKNNIYLHFTVENATVYVYGKRYEDSPLCDKYTF